MRIGDFVQQSNNSIMLVPTENYNLLGMSLEGRGLFLREQKKGSEIGAKTLNKLSTGDFIYSRLFAWKGAFDYVKPEFEGFYVSDEYPTFKIDDDKADVKFLHYYFNQAKVWKAVEQYCIGVTKASRNRFKEKFFLNYEINLPTPTVQKKIVAKIEEVKQKLEEIKNLHKEQEKDINNLLFSKYTEIVSGDRRDRSQRPVTSGKPAVWLPMKEVAPIHRRQVDIDPEQIYYEIGVRSFGRGLFENPSFKGSDLTWQKPYWMKEGDLLFSNIKAWEGAVGLIPNKYDGWVGSHRFCVIYQKNFLYFAFTRQL